MKFNLTTALICSAVIFGLTMVFGAYDLWAHNRLKPGFRSGTSQTAATTPAMVPATTRNPARVRTLLRAVHGFSRVGLEAVSTDVSAILRGFILDPDEIPLVRRQAVKALRLFPSNENFAFIKNELDSAPAGLQRVYLVSLRGFTESMDEEVAALLAPLLSSDDVGVRHAAVGLSGGLTLSTSLRTALNTRLAEEQEPSVRTAIQEALAQ